MFVSLNKNKGVDLGILPTNFLSMKTVIVSVLLFSSVSKYKQNRYLIFSVLKKIFSKTS